MQRIANPSTPVRFRPQPHKFFMNIRIKKAVIPVAGLGTRMLPATKAIPKELLPIVDKPIIQYVVEEAIDAGIEEFILVTRSGKEAIENHFDANFELEHKLEISGKKKILKKVQNVLPKKIKISSVRQEESKGLGHAILCADHLLKGEPFAVLLPDEIIYSADNIKNFHMMIKSWEDTSCGQILVEKIEKNLVSSYGVVDIKNKSISPNTSKEIVALIEKPTKKKSPSNLRIVGRYLLPNEILTHLRNISPDSSGEIQLTDALESLVKNSSLSLQAHLCSGRIFDCGSSIGFVGANLAFAREDKDLKSFLKEILMS